MIPSSCCRAALHMGRPMPRLGRVPARRCSPGQAGKDRLSTPAGVTTESRALWQDRPAAMHSGRPPTRCRLLCSMSPADPTAWGRRASCVVRETRSRRRCAAPSATDASGQSGSDRRHALWPCPRTPSGRMPSEFDLRAGDQTNRIRRRPPQSRVAAGNPGGCIVVPWPQPPGRSSPCGAGSPGPARSDRLSMRSARSIRTVSGRWSRVPQRVG